MPTSPHAAPPYKHAHSLPLSFSVLSQIQSNLGKLILKEEIERSAPVHRKTRSLPDRTHMHLGTLGYSLCIVVSVGLAILHVPDIYCMSVFHLFIGL